MFDAPSRCLANKLRQELRGLCVAGAVIFVLVIPAAFVIPEAILATATGGGTAVICWGVAALLGWTARSIRVFRNVSIATFGVGLSVLALGSGAAGSESLVGIATLAFAALCGAVLATRLRLAPSVHRATMNGAACPTCRFDCRAASLNCPACGVASPVERHLVNPARQVRCCELSEESFPTTEQS